MYDILYKIISIQTGVFIMQPTYIVIAIVLFYLFVVLFIGWQSSRRIAGYMDFIMAGKQMGVFIVAGTLAATEIGGGSSLGVIQQSYRGYGLSSVWYILSMSIALFLISLLIPKLRRTNIKTVPEYFRSRYGSKSGLLSSLVMLIPLVGITASQLIALAAVFSSILGMDYQLSVILMAVVVTTYSVMGGLWSVAFTDIFQLILIIIGIGIAALWGISYSGGWSTITGSVPQSMLRLCSGYKISDIIALIIMYFATFSVGQEVVSRFFAAKDNNTAKKSALLSSAIIMVYSVIPAILGIAIHALSDSGISLNGNTLIFSPDIIKVMPGVVCGLLIIGIISATMSSADSDILAAGSIYSNDIYGVYIKPDASDSDLLKASKNMMILVGIVSMVIALFSTVNLMKILTLSFTVRSAGTLFPYLLGQYWSRASSAGTIASILAGSAVTIYLECFSISSVIGIHFSQPIVPGLALSLVVFIVFSLLFPSRQGRPQL